MQQPTVTTTPTPSRRVRGEVAFTAAYARRDGDMRALGPWLLGYLEGLQTSPMTDTQIADTVRGIVDAWQRQRADVVAELDATIAAMAGETRCPACASHPGWAHGDVLRRVEPDDVCKACLGSGSPLRGADVLNVISR